MNKSIMLTILTLFLSNQSIAGENKIDRNFNSVYESLLSRFDCVLGLNINNPQWICNEMAPKGWGQFYGKKLKDSKLKIKKYVTK